MAKPRCLEQRRRQAAERIVYRAKPGTERDEGLSRRQPGSEQTDRQTVEAEAVQGSDLASVLHYRLGGV